MDRFVEWARQCASNRVYPMSIAQGFQDGEMMVDDEKDPKAALFWHYCGFAYISGNATEAFLATVYRDYIQTPRGRRFVLITGNAMAIDFFAGKKDVELAERAEYRYDQAPRGIPDAHGLRIEPITEQNIGRIRGRIIPSFSWSSDRRFLKNGFGFVAVDGDAVAAVAFSAAVSSDEVDIGVETDERYRRRGLAGALARRMCAEIVAGGRRPVWAHSVSNPASGRTAVSAGFTPDRINTLIRRRPE